MADELIEGFGFKSIQTVGLIVPGGLFVMPDPALGVKTPADFVQWANDNVLKDAPVKAIPISGGMTLIRRTEL